jgi:phosphatidylglycerophosphatase A
MTGLKLAIGTLFGSGLLPKAPGTWGSLATLPLVFFAWHFSPLFGVPVLIVAACILSLWTAAAAVQRYGDDPPQFVMDEVAGQALVFAATSFTYGTAGNLTWLLTGFILFRLFDILKPLGIDRLQKLHGKFGILADDLLAGIYALASLELIKLISAPLL